MAPIFYDCEFLENGTTIDLISIGMVADDGREFYAVSEHAPLARIREHDWLMANVVPSLPITVGALQLRWDFQHPDGDRIMPRAAITAGVLGFIRATPNPQLWAWYGAYDHVALCQLWGRMIDLPKGIPMFTCDLKQEAVRLGNPAVPKQEAGEHNALADARHNREIAAFLTGYAAMSGVNW